MIGAEPESFIGARRERRRARKDFGEGELQHLCRFEAEDAFRRRIDQHHRSRGVEAHETRRHAADDVARERFRLVRTRLLDLMQRRERSFSFKRATTS